MMEISPTGKPGTAPGGSGTDWLTACDSSACVKVMFDGDWVRIGHGDDSYLAFTQDEWTAFLAGAKAGRFG